MHNCQHHTERNWLTGLVDRLKSHDDDDDDDASLVLCGTKFHVQFCIRFYKLRFQLTGPKNPATL